MNIFVYQNNQPHGPYSLDEVRSRLHDGRIKETDKAWSDEFDDYLPVSQIPGLYDEAPEPRQAPLQSIPGTPTKPPPPRKTSSDYRSDFQPKLEYTGEGGEFFKLNLVNILLTLATFGIYSFWAKAKVRHFHWGNTYFMDEPLEYHATGKELFIGFLKGMVVLLPVVLILYVLLEAMELGMLMPTVFFFLYLLAMPFIIYSNRKFLLARTSWRNVRLRFNGTLGECYGLHIKSFLLIFITFGIYTPWYIAALDRFFISKAAYGTEKFEYHGNGGELFGIYIKGILLSIITFGIYSFWFQSELLRYKWNNTSIQGISFKNKLPGEELFVHTILVGLSIYGTLGIALPWVIVRFLKIKASKLSMTQTPDLAAVEAAMKDRRASSLGEGLGEAADAIGDFLGG